MQLLQEHGFTITMGGKHYDIRHEKAGSGSKAVTSVTVRFAALAPELGAKSRNTFGIDRLRYADPRDSVRGIARPRRGVQNLTEEMAFTARRKAGHRGTRRRESRNGLRHR